MEEYRATESQLQVIDKALNTISMVEHILLEGTTRFSPVTIVSVLSLARSNIIEITDEIRYETAITLGAGQDEE